MIMRTVLLAILVMAALVFIAAWRRAVKMQQRDGQWPSPVQLAIGFVTDFLDTLGIGSFATTTAAYKLFKVVSDERLVGTMIVGHSVPVVVQALIFVAAVQVDPKVLALLIAVSVIGGWLGAGISSKLPRRAIQITISIGLIAAALFMMMSQLGLFPPGGTSLTLTPGKLMFALAVNFILGVLLMLGIGNYAPSLILFSLLGMDPRAAFPVMMGSGALMAMAGGLRFIQAARFDNRAALGLTLGGIPGVLVAGLVVKSLPLSVLRWMVVVVVIYAATMMLMSATKQESAASRILNVEKPG
ncbi:MAG: sulfite exporter TauE/SafE family protein [Gemmatimonadales bacterium]